MNTSNKQTLDLAIDISGLHFSWDGQGPVLEIERLQIKRGERVFVEGPSGSGKSTLLSLIAGVITPQRGTLKVNGKHINTLNGSSRDRFRADHIGFIYQMFNLIPYLSVIENVTLSCRFSSRRRFRATGRASGYDTEAMRLLNKLGMDDPVVIKKSVTELSVGQQQRVAAARALIGGPEVLLADEPTSSLDADYRKAFIGLLFQECDRAEITLVFVSHDKALENLFDRTIRLADVNKI
jgi:putative ABC transport system ATP-binding protein